LDYEDNFTASKRRGGSAKPGRGNLERERGSWANLSVL